MTNWMAVIAVPLVLALAPAIPDRVEELATALRKLGPFSGSVLIAKDGAVVVSKGFGMANVDRGIPNTSKTKFRIGSLTKPFTAAAIMLLHERGKLDVHDRACKYLSSCPASWNDVRIHHLLTHSSGIANDSQYEHVKSSPATPADLLARLTSNPLEFPPGHQHNYGNSGYIVLGLIIESVSGQPYEVFLKKNIFDPLKMTNTGYHASRSSKDQADGYVWNGQELAAAATVDASNLYAAGGLYSTVEDLFLFDRALENETLLTRKSLDAMFTPHEDVYGYGWKIGRQFDRRFISHSGSLEGFRANIARFPEDRTTVIFLSNIDNTRLSEIAQNLSAIALGEPYDLRGLGSPVIPVRIERDPPAEPGNYKAYVGQYELPMGLFTVTMQDGKLMGQAAGEPSKAELIPQSPTEFIIPGPGDVRITFVPNSAGEVTHIEVLFKGREFRGTKTH